MPLADLPLITPRASTVWPSLAMARALVAGLSSVMTHVPLVYPASEGNRVSVWFHARCHGSPACGMPVISRMRGIPFSWVMARSIAAAAHPAERPPDTHLAEHGDDIFVATRRRSFSPSTMHPVLASDIPS